MRPEGRTTHARDAAGAAPNLGAIHHGLCVLPALPITTPASSARNVPVGWFYTTKLFICNNMTTDLLFRETSNFFNNIVKLQEYCIEIAPK
jgi:hypothetical protein